MPSLSAPTPATGTLLDTVRSSCRSAREAAGIKLDVQAIDAFLASLDEPTWQRLKLAHGVNFPLAFDSVAEEVNFLSILALLNFLSAYRTPLHKATGSGAYQAVIRLMMGLYISSSTALTALALSKLSPDGIASILDVSLHSEAPSGIPGVVMGTPKSGDMYVVCCLLAKACNETGAKLQEMGCRDLGEFVLRTLEGAQSESDERRCEILVARLASTFPAFNDAHLVGGQQPVYLYKKAFFLLQAISMRLGEKVPSIPSTQSLPMFVDNVLPTMLIHLGVLDLSESSSKALKAWGVEAKKVPAAAAEGEESKKTEPPAEGPRLKKEDAYIVRAAALDAGTVVVQRARELASQAGKEWMKDMSEADLDGYLWAVAKDDAALRKVPRMGELDTLMY